MYLLAPLITLLLFLEAFWTINRKRMSRRITLHPKWLLYFRTICGLTWLAEPYIRHCYLIRKKDSRSIYVEVPSYYASDLSVGCIRRKTSPIKPRSMLVNISPLKYTYIHYDEQAWVIPFRLMLVYYSIF